MNVGKQVLMKQDLGTRDWTQVRPLYPGTQEIH